MDLTGELGLAQSTVSSHLACLRDCGLVDFRPQGRASVYRLARPELLDMFRELDEVHAIENANDFASLINDSYDYGDRSLSVWETACAISGVDTVPYDAVFEKVNS